MSKSTHWECPATGLSSEDPKQCFPCCGGNDGPQEGQPDVWSHTMDCFVHPGVDLIPCFTPLAEPEPSVIHDMAELEVVTVPPIGAWAADTWFMASDANCGDIGERRASELSLSESDIPRIAETSARLREEEEMTNQRTTNDKPWVCKPDDVGVFSVVLDACDTEVAENVLPQDAAHIVKCVNLHDRMVKALKQVLGMLEDPTHYDLVDFDSDVAAEILTILKET